MPFKMQGHNQLAQTVLGGWRSNEISMNCSFKYYFNSLLSQNKLVVTKAPDLMHNNTVLVAKAFA